MRWLWWIECSFIEFNWFLRLVLWTSLANVCSVNNISFNVWHGLGDNLFAHSSYTEKFHAKNEIFLDGVSFLTFNFGLPLWTQSRNFLQGSVFVSGFISATSHRDANRNLVSMFPFARKISMTTGRMCFRLLIKANGSIKGHPSTSFFSKSFQTSF